MTDTLKRMEASTPLWVAMAVPTFALVGVLIAQSITLFNERARRRDEQTRVVREEVQKVMMAFYGFAEYANSTEAEAGFGNECTPYEEQWDVVANGLAAGAANMAGGQGRHRTATLELMDGLGALSRADREGLSPWTVPRWGYAQMAWAGFETVAAWLRGERIPRHSRRVARMALQMRKDLDAEYAHRARIEADLKTGVVRKFARELRWGVRNRWKKLVSGPAKKFWAYLFAA
ncbi:MULTISPECIES: hypothetical protein [Microbacterium]|uniref:hypothetical protein n=1 Tax=Microbacterium TaxID=33882 RepID=UPI0027869373|nr:MULTISPECIES: hypothetical protein [Microbacterium]MDQ1084713.1 hypothetical protein [Microbacterium sp. SORGH_AS_0344]MDQ1170010.1 hypothetical protein [Microbacterium proteolyticum]